MEEPSSSSVDDMEQHTPQSLERGGTSPSQDDIEDYNQVDISSSGSVELAGVPPYILQQLRVAAKEVPNWRTCASRLKTVSPKDLWERTSFLDAEAT